MKCSILHIPVWKLIPEYMQNCLESRLCNIELAHFIRKYDQDGLHYLELFCAKGLTFSELQNLIKTEKREELEGPIFKTQREISFWKAILSSLTKRWEVGWQRRWHDEKWFHKYGHLAQMPKCSLALKSVCANVRATMFSSRLYPFWLLDHNAFEIKALKWNESL